MMIRKNDWQRVGSVIGKHLIERHLTNNRTRGVLVFTEDIAFVRWDFHSVYSFSSHGILPLHPRINHNGNLESITPNRSSIPRGGPLNRAGGEQRTKARGTRGRQPKYLHEKMRKGKRESSVRSNRTRIILSAVLSTRKLIGLVFACLNYRWPPTRSYKIPSSRLRDLSRRFYPRVPPSDTGMRTWRAFRQCCTA